MVAFSSSSCIQPLQILERYPPSAFSPPRLSRQHGLTTRSSQSANKGSAGTSRPSSHPRNMPPIPPFYHSCLLPTLPRALQLATLIPRMHYLPL